MANLSSLPTLDYDVVDHVVYTWDKVKSLHPKTYKEDIGFTLVRKLVEESKAAFSLFEDGAEQLQVEELCASQRFRVLSISVVTMMEMAIDLLGPDLDLVSEQLLELGSRHTRFGVTRAQFDIVGEGLIIGLEKALPADIFKEKQKTSWKKFYGYVTDMMMEGEKRHRLAIEEKKKKAEQEEKERRRKQQEEDAEEEKAVAGVDSATECSDDHSSTGDRPQIIAEEANSNNKKGSSRRSSTTMKKIILNVRLMLSGRGGQAA